MVWPESGVVRYFMHRKMSRCVPPDDDARAAYRVELERQKQKRAAEQARLRAEFEQVLKRRKMGRLEVRNFEEK